MREQPEMRVLRDQRVVRLVIVVTMQRIKGNGRNSWHSQR